MKFPPIFVLFCMCFIFSVNVHSHEVSDGNITIHENLECHNWAKARASNGSAALEHYVQGYLNGYAMGRRVDLWKEPTEIKPVTFFGALDAYCGVNLFKPDIFGSMIQAVAAAEGPATTFAISIIRMPSNGPVMSDYSLFVPQYTEACHLTSRDNH